PWWRCHALGPLRVAPYARRIAAGRWCSVDPSTDRLPRAMTPTTPLAVLLPKLLEGKEPELVERAAVCKPDAPPSIDLLDIIRPEGPDPDELLKDRFLCKGGGLLMCGQTGAGKSSFNMQALVS